MGMVGGLVFFLALVGYRGGFSGQVHWTLFWFTVASVLVSRISIENGSTHGSLYGLALGAATALRMVGFLGAPLGALLLLGVVWWCASKLTWDCTVIDDDEDASGEGLLQHAGFEASGGEGAASAEGAPPAPRPGDSRKAHAPGVWVIYVSLGALPVFGFGQWMLPLSDSEARLQGLFLALLFFASASGLLLTSSFLGFRRYLRQRNLAMPAPMARAWMTLGVAMVAGALVTGLLLPRPRGLEALASLGLGLRDRPQQASSRAWMRGEAAEGEGRRIGTRARTGQGAEVDAASEAGAPPGAGETGGRDVGEGKGSRTGAAGGSERGSGPGERNSAEGSPRGQVEEGRAGASPANPPSVPPVESLFGWLRVVPWLLAGVIAVLLVSRFGRGWMASLRDSLSRPRRATSKPREVSVGPPARRFPGFNDPFASGRAQEMSGQELAVYTYEALEAWGADLGRGRKPEETPLEFGEALVQRAPDWVEELRGGVRVYTSVVYGGRAPGEVSIELLRRLWSRLSGS